MSTKNCYIIASCGVILHLMLGSTYAWSVYRNPIVAETGWNQSSITFAFSLAIFYLGMSAAFMGQVVEKFGPRVTGTISAILYASGNILTGVALANHSLLLLYLGYGVLGGIGLGTGYVTPVSMIIKWFPDKRGLATGLAIMGFGFASLLTSPIAHFLITHYGIINTFYLLGFAYLAIMLIVSQFLKFPAYNKNDTNDNHKQLNQGISAKKALKTVEFYLLWLILFINISCGLALISVVSPMAQDLAGISSNQAAIIVGLMGIFNGFGRLLWASLSDYIGRPLTFLILFVVNILMTFSLIFFHAPALFTFAMAVIMTCYGAGFSLIPPYLSDIFGAKELATMHGYILTAWAMAALAGPMLLAVTFSATQSYTTTLILFIILYLVALAIMLWLKQQKTSKYLS
ncbi:MFS transporter, OFA family, oxalate/formate antiporter [Streptococcus gallolyticus]|uniref:MFS transporter, OFA family, oxalate/formate antiporter n=1 Tax=Streptococcus gallolyticus TaxID=315405 RepID=A0A1H7XHK8_9STRE|nr:OFA family MFS transporter [Streptococcus gallolyticus]SEF21207.1 MFS transporter, OFA family, oxalate/formate antiporter [Streptococcus gallolyticus]SEM33240.1 MFS transporter, OFA family, oxalate/formate antiporter [Streptococcus gallolyticus]